MFSVSFLYVAALISVGQRVRDNRPESINTLAGQLVGLAFTPLFLAPFFWLILTEVSITGGQGFWPVIQMLITLTISYLLMISPGFYYIFKYRIKELKSYGYFTGNT